MTLHSDRLTVRYRLAAARAADRSGDALRGRAQAIALEQSLEMPLSGVPDPRIRDIVAGRVDDVREAADGTAELTLSLHVDTFGHDAGQLMNMLFGNVSLQPDVELVALEAPEAWLAGWAGPRFGIDGWRSRVGAPRGTALTCSALKPQGLAPDALAALASRLAGAGIDVIKDDHGIADQAYAPFDRRVPAVQAAIAEVNRRRDDGRTTLYAPTLSGTPAAIDAQLAVIADAGVGAALACPMLVGPSTFADICRRAGVPVLAHPALAGATRIAAPVLLGTLFRLFGADASVFPNAGGRFSFSPACCAALAAALREPLGRLRPALPVPAGGMTLERVPAILEAYGPDQMLLIGGNLLEAPGETDVRARRFVAAVHDGARDPAP